MSVYLNVFANEFKDMMNSRKSMNTSFSIMQMPVPQLGLITNEDFVDQTNGRMAMIKGIAEPYFNLLNTSCQECHRKCNYNKESCPYRLVEIAKGRTFEKRIAMRTEHGSVYREDKTEQVDLEPGFVAVYSSANIHLPNKIEKGKGPNVHKEDYRPTKGYGFIRCEDTPKGKRYLYSVPKECVFPAELCALVISLNRHSAFYKGCKVALTNGHFVYLYAIPYKYRENKGYRIIGAKTSPNFDKEMSELLNFWMNKGVLFDLNLTSVTDTDEGNYRGKNNLGIEDLPAPMSYSYDTYVRTKGALKQYEEESEDFVDLES